MGNTTGEQARGDVEMEAQAKAVKVLANPPTPKVGDVIKVPPSLKDVGDLDESTMVCTQDMSELGTYRRLHLGK